MWFLALLFYYYFSHWLLRSSTSAWLQLQRISFELALRSISLAPSSLAPAFPFRFLFSSFFFSFALLLPCFISSSSLWIVFSLLKKKRIRNYILYCISDALLCSKHWCMLKANVMFYLHSRHFWLILNHPFDAVILRFFCDKI